MNDMCRVPVRASYAVVNGKAQRISAEYAEIPAQLIADLFMQHFGFPAQAEREKAETIHTASGSI